MKKSNLLELLIKNRADIMATQFAVAEILASVRGCTFEEAKKSIEGCANRMETATRRAVDDYSGLS